MVTYRPTRPRGAELVKILHRGDTALNHSTWLDSSTDTIYFTLLSAFIYHVSHVTCHMSLTLTATSTCHMSLTLTATSTELTPSSCVTSVIRYVQTKEKCVTTLKYA